MKRLLVVLAISLLGACAGASRPPTNVFKAPPEFPFSIRLIPRIALAGQSIWVTCHVPRSYPMGELTYGIGGIRVSTDQLETTKQDFRVLVERLPPGKWEAFCAFVSRDGLVKETRTETVEIIGPGGG